MECFKPNNTLVNKNDIKSSNKNETAKKLATTRAFLQLRMGLQKEKHS